jgi:UDPglucose 6-dehydrogenase
VRVSGYDQLKALVNVFGEKHREQIETVLAAYKRHIKQRGFTRHDGYVTLTVRAVEHEEVQTTVYSLETQTGTVIGASGLIFHNCFPKDVKALAYMAQIHGTNPQLLQAVMEINITQRRQIVIKLQDLLGDLKGKVIGLLGLAFKENTDDIRVSPALEIAEMLHDLGAVVRGYDPVAMENTARLMPFINLTQDPYDLAAGCDGLVVATPWNEFKSLDMGRIRAAMRQPVLVDGRNLYDAALMQQLGFHYRGVGRGYNGALGVLESETDDR